MSAHNYRGYVYFVTCDRYVKIGYTATKPEQRMATILRGHIIKPTDLDESQPLSLLHAIPGCIVRDERRLHGLFAAHHAAGEWYHLTPAFLRQLAGLRYVPDAEVLLRLRRARADLKKAQRRTFLADAA